MKTPNSNFKMCVYRRYDSAGIVKIEEVWRLYTYYIGISYETRKKLFFRM